MSANSIEKRAVPRQRVLKHGMPAFHGGGGIDCTVRTLSPAGARVDIVSPMGIPAAFTLIIEADQFMRRCRTVWSSDRRIGVAFEQPASP